MSLRSHILLFLHLMTLDEMDGTVPGGRRDGRKNYLPEQEVRREAGELRLVRGTVQLQSLGCTGRCCLVMLAYLT